MRKRAAIAVPAASAAVAALLLTAPPGQAAPRAPRVAPCVQGELALRAATVPHRPTVVRVSVTNRSGRACAIDRVPLVTFGGLDGAALPVSGDGTGRLRLAAGATVHADVRTIARAADPQARRAASVTVGDWTGRWGRVFAPARLGTGSKVAVWEPVTTPWQSSTAAADRALGLGAGTRTSPRPTPTKTTPSPSPSPTGRVPHRPSPTPPASPSPTSPAPTSPSPTGATPTGPVSPAASSPGPS
ncbi:DUF4232 domain-containing protein [Streptomyces sp. LaBMicrA B280]|uniref:DUF4232 domain-containing protein n=1 Tax=Streptomyces sp. LaBMicrA B280 TaxID=3391001 RepID=UPI003BA60F28